MAKEKTYWEGRIDERIRIEKVLTDRLDSLAWNAGRYEDGTPQKMIFSARIEDTNAILKEIRRNQKVIV